MNIFPLRLLVNRTIRTLCPALLLLPIACNESGLTIRVIDPLTNVLPGIVCPPAGDDTVRVARGENAVLQFVISADDSVAAMNPVLRSLKTKQGASLDKAVLGWVRNVQASHAYVPAAPDAPQSPSGEYPDPILTDTTVSIAAGRDRFSLVGHSDSGRCRSGALRRIGTHFRAKERKTDRCRPTIHHTSLSGHASQAVVIGYQLVFPR